MVTWNRLGKPFSREVIQDPHFSETLLAMFPSCNSFMLISKLFSLTHHVIAASNQSHYTYLLTVFDSLITSIPLCCMSLHVFLTCFITITFFLYFSLAHPLAHFTSLQKRLFNKWKYSNTPEICIYFCTSQAEKKNDYFVGLYAH